jgi:1-acyl-sn-glycerol-3-phosphate acyltransferase
MKLLRALHTVYGFIVFIVLFLLLFPLLLIPISFPSQWWLTGVINRWWAKLLFLFVGLPYKIELRGTLDKKRQYIFCANHFSYLDIPTFGLNPVTAIFVGKNSIARVPLFGYMYSKLHITVDRASLRSRFNTMKQSLQAIDEGKSLMIFPEGGIVAHNPPQMSPFKEGAFRVAIEKQIPVVPVTIANNWIILPDPENRLRWGLVKIIFHEPIETRDMTIEDVDDLKQKVFQVISYALRTEHAKYIAENLTPTASED